MFEIGNNTDIDAMDPVLGPGRTKQSRVAMNDDIIIAIAHTNEVPYGDPSNLSSSGGDLWYTYTYIARMLKNTTNPAVNNWEIF